MLPEQDDAWWAAAFRFAVIQTGIAPAQFWRLSLPELAALAAAPGPTALDAPGRSELDTMMLAHPDRQASEDRKQEER
ncbi:MAG: phage tail assembly chaperone [Phyllobacteriaceae bacterium]|nr:phage tail assembly chaperone [Phyllobacteriaceae bacterium]